MPPTYAIWFEKLPHIYDLEFIFLAIIRSQYLMFGLVICKTRLNSMKIIYSKQNQVGYWSLNNESFEYQSFKGGWTNRLISFFTYWKNVSKRIWRYLLMTLVFKRDFLGIVEIVRSHSYITQGNIISSWSGSPTLRNSKLYLDVDIYLTY
jgi:hypothetical protein